MSGRIDPVLQEGWGREVAAQRQNLDAAQEREQARQQQQASAEQAR